MVGDRPSIVQALPFWQTHRSSGTHTQLSLCGSGVGSRSVAGSPDAFSLRSK